MTCPRYARIVHPWGAGQQAEPIPNIVPVPLPEWHDRTPMAKSKELRPIYAEPHPLFDWLHANAKGPWQGVAVLDIPRYRWRPTPNAGKNAGIFYRARIGAWGVAFDLDDDRLLYRLKWT